MKFNTPKCIGGKDCYTICNTKGCLNTPFMCLDGCQCQQAHKQCHLNIKWKVFKELFSKKIIEPSAQITNYLNQVGDIYKSIIKQIQIAYNEIMNLQKTLGLYPIQRDIFHKICQNKVNELSGNLMSKIKFKSERSKIIIMKDNDIQESKKQFIKETQDLLKNLSYLTEQKNLLDSKLIKDIQEIAPFFTLNIKKCNLLYRASENNFQLSEFWKKCEHKKNTITIIKTEFGNIIGGYTPLIWAPLTEFEFYNYGPITYSTDISKSSFIFSLTNKHKLNLREGKQSQAIQKSQINIPTFGVSNLWIVDKANINVDSGARPGSTYNNGLYADNQQSYKKFSGQSDGYGFRVIQWQIHEIIFQYL